MKIQMTVKAKLVWLGVLVAVAIVTQLLIQRYAMNSIVALEQKATQVAKIESGMLTLRRNEKDFLARNDLKYRDKFEKNYQRLQQQVTRLTAHLEESGMDASKGDSVAHILTLYKDKFTQLVTIQQKIGLHHKDGLYGDLRKAVHTVEEDLKAHNDYQLLKDMLMLRRNEKDFMLRSDLKYLDKFEKNLALFQQDLATSTLPEDSKATIRTHLDEYKTNFQGLIDGYVQKGLNSKEGLHGELRSTVHKTEGLFKEMESDLLAKLSAHAAWLEKVSVAFPLCFALLVFGFIWLIARSISRPVSELSGVMTEACENMDLSVRAQDNGKDEIAAMASVFNTMTAQFQTLIHQVQDSSQQVSAAAEGLSVTTKQTSKGMQDQQSESSLVTRSMKDMSVAMQEVARSAIDATQVSNSADEQARQGKQVVTEAGESIRTLAEIVDNSSHAIQELEQESKNIGDMLSVIQSIAEQTNLLALNAAIEAARAGESGRGFAVVADEVRSLAQRSQESTANIKSIIERLQSGAKASVQTMEKGRVQAILTVEQAESAGRSLDSITSAVAAINAMNTQIAAAAEQQSSAVDEINQNVMNIAQVTEDTAQAANDTTLTSDNLAGLAMKLQQHVGQFKL